MFIVISVVEFGTKISSLLPILLDLCENMKMNYFDISLSELRSNDILSSTFVVVLSFLDNIILQCKDFCCFHISLLIEISPREVGQVEESSSTILYFSDNIAMEIFLIFSHFSLN